MLRLTLITVAMLATIGCARDSIDSLKSPERLTLYSIDGRDDPSSNADQVTAVFHGYPVLGKVEITDAEQIKQFLAALRRAITEGRNSVAKKCFWPRHGVRAEQNGKTVDFVICFQCSQFDEYLDGEHKRHELIGNSTRAAFDKPLKDAGVPFAP